MCACFEHVDCACACASWLRVCLHASSVACSASVALLLLAWNAAMHAAGSPSDLHAACTLADSAPPMCDNARAACHACCLHDTHCLLWCMHRSCCCCCCSSAARKTAAFLACAAPAACRTDPATPAASLSPCPRCAACARCCAPARCRVPTTSDSWTSRWRTLWACRRGWAWTCSCTASQSAPTWWSTLAHSWRASPSPRRLRACAVLCCAVLCCSRGSLRRCAHVFCCVCGVAQHARAYTCTRCLAPSCAACRAAHRTATPVLSAAQGWVQSYGSRYVRPPIITGDVAFAAPMTVREYAVAAQLTAKHVKGMLTGEAQDVPWQGAAAHLFRVAWAGLCSCGPCMLLLRVLPCTPHHIAAARPRDDPQLELPPQGCEPRCTGRPAGAGAAPRGGRAADGRLPHHPGVAYARGCLLRRCAARVGSAGGDCILRARLCVLLCMQTRVCAWLLPLLLNAGGRACAA